MLLAFAGSMLWQNLHNQSTRAADISFVGAPTLPASTVDTILARMGSPMVGVGSVVVETARANNIDDAFALAVWDVETSEGAAGVGRTDLNPGSVRGSTGYSSGLGGYTLYPSYAEGIRDWFRVVQSRYVARGLTSVYTLCVPYVGTSSSYSWAAKVTNLMERFRAEAPPPTPTPVVQDISHVGANADQIQSHAQLTQLRQTNTQSKQKTGKTAHTLQPGKGTQQEAPSLASEHPQTLEQPYFLGAILLVAVLVALGGLLIGGSKTPLAVSISEPEQQRHNPITPLPALYVNQYSPLSTEPETGPQITIAPAFASYRPMPLRLPSLPATVAAEPAYRVQPMPQVTRVASSTPSRGGGLLKRYGLTEQAGTSVPPVAPISPVQHMQHVQPAQPISEAGFGQSFFATHERITEDLFYYAQARPEAAQDQTQFSSRQPEPVGTFAPRSGGGTFRKPRRLVPLSNEER